MSTFSVSEMQELLAQSRKAEESGEITIGGFRQLPVGEYEGRIVQVEQTLSKAGDPMIVVDYEVTEGEEAGYLGKTFTGLTGDYALQNLARFNKLAIETKSIQEGTHLEEYDPEQVFAQMAEASIIIRSVARRNDPTQNNVYLTGNE